MISKTKLFQTVFNGRMIRQMPKILPGVSLAMKIKGDAVPRPEFYQGVYQAAWQARALDLRRTSMIGFGVFKIRDWQLKLRIGRDSPAESHR